MDSYEGVDFSLAGFAAKGFLGPRRFRPAFDSSCVHFDFVHVAIVAPGPLAEGRLSRTSDRTRPVRPLDVKGGAVSVAHHLVIHRQAKERLVSVATIDCVRQISEIHSVSYHRPSSAESATELCGLSWAPLTKSERISEEAINPSSEESIPKRQSREVVRGGKSPPMVLI